jgi:hypothetical protein
MRLYRGSIPKASEEIVQSLLEARLIEAPAPRDVMADVAAVLTSYVEAERDITDRAKSHAQARGLPPTEVARIRKSLAEQRGIQLGDELLDYLLAQLIEMLMHSGNVDEVFGEDHDLRRVMRTPLRKHLELEQAVDAEVRGKLKHVQEGTRTWEVEYRRVLEEVQRRKGLS